MILWYLTLLFEPFFNKGILHFVKQKEITFRVCPARMCSAQVCLARMCPARICLVLSVCEPILFTFVIMSQDELWTKLDYQHACVLPTFIQYKNILLTGFSLIAKYLYMMVLIYSVKIAMKFLRKNLDFLMNNYLWSEFAFVQKHTSV